MEEHLSIFEDIYDIKDNITDGQFLILNNKLQKLIKEIKDLKKKLSKRDIIVHHVPIIIHEIESITQQHCSCSTRWIFPNSYSSIDDLTRCFCLETLERMQNCENFKKLMDKLPLLENLFRRIDLPFAEEGIYQEYVKNEFTMIGKILLFFIEKISGKRNRIITTFVMFDFIIRNANFLKDYQRYATAVCNKFEELLTDTEYIPLLLEFNINYSKWIDIMKSNIISE